MSSNSQRASDSCAQLKFAAPIFRLSDDLLYHTLGFVTGGFYGASGVEWSSKVWPSTLVCKRWSKVATARMLRSPRLGQANHLILLMKRLHDADVNPLLVAELVVDLGDSDEQTAQAEALAVLFATLNQLENLRCLVITGTVELASAFLFASALPRLSKLRYLDLSDETGDSLWTSAAVAQAAQAGALSTIRVLELSIGDIGSVAPEALCFPQLVELHLTAIQGFGLLSQLVRRSGRLRYLAAISANSLDGNQLAEAIAPVLPTLEALDVRGYAPGSLDVVLRRAKCLKALIVRVKGLSDIDSLTSLAPQLVYASVQVDTSDAVHALAIVQLVASGRLRYLLFSDKKPTSRKAAWIDRLQVHDLR